MAGNIQFTNNAATTLLSGITSSATTLTVAAGTGTLFPALSGSQFFYCTLINTAGTVLEIVKVTARTTDVFTIVRAQDNTTASAFIAGDKVELRLTAADLQNFPQLDSTNTFAAAQTFSAGITSTVTPVAVASGGTGAGTLTGLVVGNGTSAFTTVTAPSGTVIGTTDTQTLTNKRITPRVLASTANSATPTLNTDTYDMMVITGQTVAITSFTTNLTGTPTNGQKLQIAITGTGAIALTFGASFEASTVALPTTTVTTARLDVGFVYNSATSKWRCVAVA
jgi:hypothetical protein